MNISTNELAVVLESCGREIFLCEHGMSIAEIVNLTSCYNR